MLVYPSYGDVKSPMLDRGASAKARDQAAVGALVPRLASPPISANRDKSHVCMTEKEAIHSSYDIFVVLQ